MNGDKVVVYAAGRLQAFVGVIVKTYKDDSVVVEFAGGQRRFTRYGQEHGGNDYRAEYYPQPSAEQKVAELNQTWAERKERRERELEQREQEQAQRYEEALKKVRDAEYTTVTTPTGELIIYTIGDGALIVKESGAAPFGNERYWSIARTDANGMSASTATAATAIEAAAIYVATWRM